MCWYFRDCLDHTCIGENSFVLLSLLTNDTLQVIPDQKGITAIFANGALLGCQGGIAVADYNWQTVLRCALSLTHAYISHTGDDRLVVNNIYLTLLYHQLIFYLERDVC